MTPMPKLLLLDGHSLAYRAFFALPTDLATKAGTVTNAVYGFTSMLTKVMTDEKPDYLAVAFDAPGGSIFRNDLDPEYKAGRREMPDGDIVNMHDVEPGIDERWHSTARSLEDQTAGRRRLDVAGADGGRGIDNDDGHPTLPREFARYFLRFEF